MLRQGLARPGPRAVGVWVVGRPHDVADAGRVTLPDAHEVPEERRVTLPIPVHGRLLLGDRLRPEAGLLERLIHATEDSGDPPDGELDEQRAKRRVAAEERR